MRLDRLRRVGVGDAVRRSDAYAAEATRIARASPRYPPNLGGSISTRMISPITRTSPTASSMTASATGSAGAPRVAWSTHSTIPRTATTAASGPSTVRLCQPLVSPYQCNAKTTTSSATERPPRAPLGRAHASQPETHRDQERRHAGSLKARGRDGVAEQHRDRHRADAAGYRGDQAGDSASLSKSTSPTSPSSNRLIPTSITTAPGLMYPAPSSLGTPTAAIRTSARAQTAARSRSASGTSSPSRCARAAARDRLADEIRAADDDRLGALELEPRSGRAVRSRRAACTAAGPACPEASRPALTGVSPSTSFSGRNERRQRPRRRAALGHRELEEDAADLGVGVQARRSAARPLPAGRRRAGARWKSAIPASAQALRLLAM